MMKTNAPQLKWIGALLLLGGIFLLLNCTTDRVTWELTEYVNQDILHIAELEKRSLGRYAAARGEHYTTDENLYHVLKEEVIPEYKRFLGLLRNIQPETEEVKALHYMYVRGTENIYRGFKLKMLGLETNDELLDFKFYIMYGVFSK